MMVPGRARELLLVEALGDAAKLFDRVEGLISALDLTSQGLERASVKFETRAEDVEKYLTVIGNQVMVKTVEHIVTRADEVGRKLNSSLTHDMRTVAHELFENELQTALFHLGKFIEARTAHLHSRREVWINIVAFCCGALLTMSLVMYFWGR